MTRFVSSGLFLLVLGRSTVIAQTDCPSRPPGYELLRQDEDYRSLSNPACRKDYWDRVKFVPLGSNPDAFFTLGGEIREWYEGYRNANWGLGPQDANGYLFQRLSIYSDIHATSRVRLFAELTSDLEDGRVGGPRPVTDQSTLFFEEAFADITLSKRAHAQLVMRLGRQEFEFGAGRLVDVREGPNVRQTFDGASLNWKASSWSMTGFALRPVLNGTGVWDAPPDHGSNFWGIYATRAVPKINGASVDVITSASHEERQCSTAVRPTSYAIPLAEGFQVAAAVGAMTAKPLSRGAVSAREAFVPGAPATIPRIHFDPSAYSRRSVQARLSLAVAVAMRIQILGR